MDTKVVDSDSSQGRIDKGLAIAAVLQATPSILWYALVTIVGGFIVLALWFNHNNLQDFTSGVLVWMGRVLIAVGVVLLAVAARKCYLVYHNALMELYDRKAARATLDRQQLLVERARLQNEQLLAKIEMERQLPVIMKYAMQQGHNISYDGKGLKVENYLSNVHSLGTKIREEDTPALPAGQQQLPTNVLYNDIRNQVPQGHILVGIGAQGLETRDRAVGACTWIVGLSRTGKTSTSVLRVEERKTDSNKFLGIDPHWFKPDSLTNALAAYMQDFIIPMAKTPAENLKVLQYFVDEFNARKAGQRPQPWQKITLIVDEVTSLMDVTSKEEKAVAELLPSIARICGQEAANFNMGGIFISQQATGLAWLRKMALMVIVHQLLMQSEKELACNYDKEVIEDMKRWPIGRTYVYGVGFTDGPRTVQQPFFEPPAAVAGPAAADVPVTPAYACVESTLASDEEEGDTLTADEKLVLDAVEAGQRGPRALERHLGWTFYRAKKTYDELQAKGLID